MKGHQFDNDPFTHFVEGHVGLGKGPILVTITAESGRPRTIAFGAASAWIPGGRHPTTLADGMHRQNVWALGADLEQGPVEEGARNAAQDWTHHGNPGVTPVGIALAGDRQEGVRDAGT